MSEYLNSVFDVFTSGTDTQIALVVQYILENKVLGPLLKALGLSKMPGTIQWTDEAIRVSGQVFPKSDLSSALIGLTLFVAQNSSQKVQRNDKTDVKKLKDLVATFTLLDLVSIISNIFQTCKNKLIKLDESKKQSPLVQKFLNWEDVVGFAISSSRSKLSSK